MDTSKKYIRMCAQAKEIQRLWVQHHGDVFFTESEGVKYWISDIHKSEQIRNGWVVTTESEVIHLSKVTWLPRQSQLIEMAQETGKRFEKVLQIFFDWANTPYNSPSEPAKKMFPSMEQIWIAFVMQKNFMKKWNGSRWVTVLPG